VRSGELAQRASVVVASERMDDDPGWSALEPGELVHVGRDLKVERRRVIDAAPARLLTLQDLDPKAAASQGEATT
jgi:glutamine amidotransferase